MSVDPQNVPAPFSTLAGNYNGGVYVIARELVDRVGAAWAHWARWLVARVELLDRWAVHVDQVAFCLAVRDLSLPLALLDDTWNFPLHLNVVADGDGPVLLHHHAAFDPHRLLPPAGAPRARAAVARVNRVLESCRHWAPPIPARVH